MCVNRIEKNEIFCLKGNSETIQDTKICENVSSCSELRVVKMEFSVSVDWRILTKRKGNSETLPDPEIGENVSLCPELRVIKIGQILLVSIEEFSQRGRAIVRPSQTRKFVRMYFRALHFGSLRGEISISVCKLCIKRIQIFISDFSACRSPET